MGTHLDYIPLKILRPEENVGWGLSRVGDSTLPRGAHHGFHGLTTSGQVHPPDFHHGADFTAKTWSSFSQWYSPERLQIRQHRSWGNNRKHEDGARVKSGLWFGVRASCPVNTTESQESQHPQDKHILAPRKSRDFSSLWSGTLLPYSQHDSEVPCLMLWY